MISTAEFRNGSPLMVEGQPFYIVEFQHVKPGKGGAFVRTKLKSYLSGNVLDRTFRSGEKFDTPQIEECDMQFLYAKRRPAITPAPRAPHPYGGAFHQ